MLSCFSSIKNFSAKLNTVKIPLKMRISNPFKNPVYNVDNTEIEKLFYKDCFPDTYDYLHSLKSIDFLTVSKSDVQKIKKATEELHRVFVNATEHVLKDKSLYSKFNINKENWKMIGDNFQRTKNNYFYGRMDIGFNFDFSQIKIFEYNTGLCGDIYDTSEYQNKVFDYFVKQNPNQIKNKSQIINSISSGHGLLKKVGERWEILSKNCKNKTIYFIYDETDREEKLVLSSIFKGLKTKGIPYKLFSDRKCLIKSEKGLLYDKITNEKIDILYKTHPWYSIYRNLKNLKEGKKARGDFYEFFLNKKTKIVEPMWKTVMGNKALLPYVYSLHKDCKYLIPSSFDPFDECFGDDEYIIEKGLMGRGSMMTKKVKRSEITKKNPNVIYQKIFKENYVDNNYYIMGSWIVGDKFSGMFVKQSNTMINEYSCNVIPVRILL